MTTLEEIREEYDRLDKLLGINTSGLRLSFSKRMVKKYGTCEFRRSCPVEITLADFLRHDEQQLLMTARHEYAHAACAILTGERHGHDEAWKKICRIIDCPDERTTAPSAAAHAHTAPPKYIVRCDGCGTETPYYRRANVVDALLEGRCRCTCLHCGSQDFRVLVRREKTA